MNEAAFLERIRQRITAPTGERTAVPHPGPFPAPARRLPDDLAAEFSRRLTAAGGRVYPARDAAEAGERLAAVVADLRQAGHTLQRVILTDHVALRELELDDLLPRLGLEGFRLPHPSWRAQDADLGLTGVDYALAASGTMVMAAAPGHPRNASLLPPIHIAIVQRSQLLPDLAALADRIQRDFPQRPPSGLALITGPSRTADIEQTLSIGVHGPGEVHVLLV